MTADEHILECMKSSSDGSHCGLTDWYPEIERGIQCACLEGKDYPWTTGWYSSKKECASARVTNGPDGIKVEVSVTDDFDTEGYGWRMIQHTDELGHICEAIYDAWDEAEQVRKDNSPYVGFALHRDGWNKRDLLQLECVDWYVWPRDGDLDGDPPGDHYHNWGFQDAGTGEVIPAPVKQMVEEWARCFGGGSFTTPKIEGSSYTLKEWDEV